MDLNKYTYTPDSELKIFAFTEEPIQSFIDAFERYRICLTPLRGEGNITIEKELVLIDEIVNQLQQKKKIATTQGDAPIRLIFINWCLFTDVVFKYWAIKNTEFRDKERKVLSKYALEGDKIKLNAINRTAQIELFAEIDKQRYRNRTRVDDFHLTEEMIKNTSGRKTTAELFDDMKNNLSVKKPTVKKYEYLVAFSYAGEQAGYVEQVARYIRNKGIRAFMDKLETVEMWGADLIDYLSDIYANKARWCVMFISQEYADKAFPNLERQIIQARSLKEKDYLLPARFDNAHLQGSVHTKTYIHLSNYTPEQFGDLIIAKVTGKQPQVQQASSQSLPLPKVNKDFNPFEEKNIWIQYLSKELKQAGRGDTNLLMHTEIDSEGLKVRVMYKHKIVFSINIYKNGFASENGLSFSAEHGEIRYKNSSVNAWSTFSWSKEKDEVVLNLVDMMFFDLPNEKKNITKRELLEAIWKKIVRIIESQY